MAPKKPKNGSTARANTLAEYAAKCLDAAEQRRIKTKPVERFPLDEGERTILSSVPALPAKFRKKLAKNDTAFSFADVAGIMMAQAALPAGEQQQTALLAIGNKLANCLYRSIARFDNVDKAKRIRPTDTVYQFKITLLGAKPPIWRRIQVKDCTLDKLHEHIQTSMGWTNSHLHDFKIGEVRYADPMLMEDSFKEVGYKDSTTTLLSKIIPKTCKRFSFCYEYDFGDCWEHEVLFEGCPKAEPGRQYPSCLEGERACPPDDVGGVGGYGDFLNAIQDKSHEEREESLEWVSGWFDPEEFDPVTATKSMKKGLPDWRME